MYQSFAKVSEADIERLIIRDYGAANHDSVRRVLSEYASSEGFRVKAGAMKLADGDIETLRLLIKDANRDYRDILLWAEYSMYSRVDSAHRYKTPVNLKELASAADAQAYDYWFNRKVGDPKVSPSAALRDAGNDDPLWQQAIEHLEKRIISYHSYAFILSTQSKSWPERFDIMIETTFFPALAEFAVDNDSVMVTLKIGTHDKPREVRHYRWTNESGVIRTS